ncbi:MAG: VOC family protein [Thermoplasmata archaeon]|nr:VOC family protein [Thermoplasmata archaeon]
MKHLTPNLMVEDVNKTLRFYREILKFELVMAVPTQGRLEWALMKCGDVEIIFQSRFSLTEELVALRDVEIGGSLTLYFEIRGIEELYEMVKDQVEIVQELHPTFYGLMEFAMRDCNGYILVFADRPSVGEGEP